MTLSSPVDQVDRAVCPATDLTNCRITLEQVVEANADAIVVVGLDQRIQYTNASAEALFARSREELVGSPFGMPVTSSNPVEVNIVRSRGGEIVAEMRANRVDWLGQPVYVVSLRDVTARKEMEAELRQVHKMEALGNLAGGISHEFNNLLTAILFSSSLLVEQIPEEDPLHRYATRIRSVANRAAALTGQLLTFSRKRQVKPELHDLSEIVSGVTGLLAQVISRKVQLETIVSPEPALALVDRDQIEQVIINLAVNANDAMSDGGRLECRVETVDTDGGDEAGSMQDRYVALTVRDTGCGMPPEVQARIFEPFFTTKPEGRGTGLGLSTVHGIIHQAGGKILVQSRPGEGTTFQVLLPRRDRLEGADGPIHIAKRVLVVEDDEDVRSVMEDVLVQRGFQVEVAGDGNEALRIMHRATRPFDLVVTDLVMPGGGGRQLADDIREQHPEMPIVFVSGYAKEDLPDRYRADSRSIFVGKPFTANGLAISVSSLIARPQLEPQRIRPSA